MGRRAHKPDPASQRQVEAMAGYGIPEADIATVLEIDPKTLRKHYRRQLDKGHIKATAKVAENLYRRATGEGRESVIAAIFWLKTRAGWKETSVTELASRDKEPVTVIMRTIYDPTPPDEIQLVAPPMIEGRVVRTEPSETKREEQS
jgi:hypothetical protein